MISVSNLKKSFGDLVVLDGITETIEKGEKVVVIGPSGSGKSTFLRCLNLLEQPTSGVIEFEGRDITHAKGRELNSVRMKMGMVFQHFNAPDYPPEHHYSSGEEQDNDPGSGGQARRRAARDGRAFRQG